MLRGYRTINKNEHNFSQKPKNSILWTFNHERIQDYVKIKIESMKNII